MSLAVAARGEDFDPGLRRLQRFLALAGEGDTTLERLECRVERQVAALEPLHELLKLTERLLEIRRFCCFAQRATHGEKVAPRYRGAGQRVNAVAALPAC